VTKRQLTGWMRFCS